jgi:hypothetical protein
MKSDGIGRRLVVEPREKRQLVGDEYHLTDEISRTIECAKK